MDSVSIQEHVDGEMDLRLTVIIMSTIINAPSGIALG